MNSNDVKVNEIEKYSDERGDIFFSNQTSLTNFSRFYFIKHKNTSIIRAWQGHKYESKIFIPIKGVFLLAWVKIDNFEFPSKELKAETIILSSKNYKSVYIPPGYANGLKALEKNSIIQVFSEFDNEKSVEEKIRFPKENWLNWNKY